MKARVGEAVEARRSWSAPWEAAVLLGGGDASGLYRVRFRVSGVEALVTAARVRPVNETRQTRRMVVPWVG